MQLSMSCPRCQSDKHTSLPFGNGLRADGSAKAYRCLVCGFFFVRRIGEDRKDPAPGRNRVGASDFPLGQYL